MFCSKCGVKMNETAKFCSRCGNKNIQEDNGITKEPLNKSQENVQQQPSQTEQETLCQNQVNSHSNGASYITQQRIVYDDNSVDYEVSSNIFLNFKSAVIDKYARFNGRATRWEVWSYQIVFFIILVVAALIDEKLSQLVELALFIPGLALNARRLHDTNRSGWYMLIPIYGSILILFAKSDPLPNQYGKVRKRPNQ